MSHYKYQVLHVFYYQKKKHWQNIKENYLYDDYL